MKIRNPFPPHRNIIFDLIILITKKIITKIIYSKKAFIIGDDHNLKQYFQNDRFSFSLVTDRVDDRGRSIRLTMDDKIQNIFILGETNLKNHAHDGRIFQIKKDWAVVWDLINHNLKENHFFIISTSDDIAYLLLRFHPLKKYIIFDSFDTIYYNTESHIKKLLSKCSFLFSDKFIFRDPRFKKMYIESGKRQKRYIYVPDQSRIKRISNLELKNKFENKERIKLISSGWVSDSGEEGILESLMLIIEKLPYVEINICMTNAMINNIRVTQKISELSQNYNVIIHKNLSEDNYREVLYSCHLGLAVQDNIVFERPSKLSKNGYTKRCASSRVLDYAHSGCILLTTKEHRFMTYQFKKASPHREVIILDNSFNMESINKISERILSNFTE